MRGPKPQPTVLKLVRGNPGKRPLPKGEPQPAKGIGPCPDSLSPAGRVEWSKVVAELDRLGMLTCVDGAALEAYCEAVAMMKQAQVEVQRDGMTTMGHRGPIRNPAVSVWKDCAALVRQFAAEFGLTPAARTRLQAPAQENKDELAEFLKSGT